MNNDAKLPGRYIPIRSLKLINEGKLTKALFSVSLLFIWDS
jgi:hypothetical protein